MTMPEDSAIEGLRRQVARGVRRLREEAGLSREALAEEAGLAGRSVADCEDCRRTPSLLALARIADVLGMRVEVRFTTPGGLPVAEAAAEIMRSRAVPSLCVADKALLRKIARAAGMSLTPPLHYKTVAAIARTNRGHLIQSRDDLGRLVFSLPESASIQSEGR